MADTSQTPANGTGPGSRIVFLFVLSGALLALPFAAKYLEFGAATSFATRIIITAIAAASLNLILGYGGMISFGHAAFFGVGGYVVGILYAHARSGEAIWGLFPGASDMAVTLPLVPT